MTVTNCANCPLARRIENERYECTSAHKDMVVRGHWRPTQDCQDAISEHETELQAAIAQADYEFKMGHHMGFWDAAHGTETYAESDSKEWMEGWYVGYQEKLAEMLAKQAVAEQRKHELEIARNKLGTGWRVIYMKARE